MSTFGTGTFGSGTFGAPAGPAVPSVKSVDAVDAAGAADTASVRFQRKSTVTGDEQAGATDTASVRLLRRLVVTDLAGAGDTATVTARSVRAFIERAGGSDSVMMLGDGRFRLSDRVRATDSFTLKLTPKQPRGSVFGDAEAAVIAVLRDDADLDGVSVAGDLIGYSGGRWLRVQRTGGIPTPWRRTDNPALDISVYAEGKGAALDMAWTARAAIHGARGRYAGHGLAICDVYDVEGPAWTPDDLNPDAARYVFRVALVTKPMAAT